MIIRVDDYLVGSYSQTKILKNLACHPLVSAMAKLQTYEPSKNGYGYSDTGTELYIHCYNFGWGIHSVAIRVCKEFQRLNGAIAWTRSKMDLKIESLAQWSPESILCVCKKQIYSSKVNL